MGVLETAIAPQVLSTDWWTGGSPLPIPSLTIGMELSQIVLSPVWFSMLRLTTGVHPALCRDEFREPRSDTVRLVALVTTTTEGSWQPVWLQDRENDVLMSLTKLLTKEAGVSCTQDTEGHFQEDSKVWKSLC
ncbi:hypothetical protein TNCV_4231121 [Trichonephila clavipes]|uniref:Uncharacterized protein n=1 Tax=Trichonephila clavipes TaxID=2585209 RepID=A0A8X6SRF5_TRICX|nr:hypothetical protein TNCV_4231121 [Trichonephila clavipes]